MPEAFVCTSNAANYDVYEVVAELWKTTSALQRKPTPASARFRAVKLHDFQFRIDPVRRRPIG
jgi:hypothetical protein